MFITEPLSKAPALIAWGLIISVLMFINPIFFFIGYGVFEVLAHYYIQTLRRHFQWMITAKDEYPLFSKELLDKFFAESFDSELGWCRKPNTTKEEKGKFGPTRFHINHLAQRSDPDHEHLPHSIATFGDSFTFGRQVNDNETYQWYLSALTQSNVLNYGVGNYGLDQALLRMYREYPKVKSKIVIVGVVPSTIVRILSTWKHYSEFGNILAFKPRFMLEGNILKYIPNKINSREKFIFYKKYLSEIQREDYFYESKFKQEMLYFPYAYSLFKSPRRHFSLLNRLGYGLFNKHSHQEALAKIMEINLDLRRKLFKDNGALNLLIALVDSFSSFAKIQGFIPIFMWMPQKDDILSIQENGHYYNSFILSIKQKTNIIDLTSLLLTSSSLNDYYSDDSVYGGHFSQEGNQWVASIVYQYLIDNRFILKTNLEKTHDRIRDAHTPVY